MYKDILKEKHVDFFGSSPICIIIIKPKWKHCHVYMLTLKFLLYRVAMPLKKSTLDFLNGTVYFWSCRTEVEEKQLYTTFLL